MTTPIAWIAALLIHAQIDAWEVRRDVTPRFIVVQGEVQYEQTDGPAWCEPVWPIGWRH